MTIARNLEARLVAVSAVALLTFLVASSAVAAVNEAASGCVAKGPKFAVQPAHGGAPIKGDTYSITTMSMGDARPTCAWARAALAGIFRANPPPLRTQQALKGGPPGFSCTGGTGGVIVAPKLAASGHCTKTANGRSGQLFQWGAVAPKLVR